MISARVMDGCAEDLNRSTGGDLIGVGNESRNDYSFLLKNGHDGYELGLGCLSYFASRILGVIGFMLLGGRLTISFQKVDPSRVMIIDSAKNTDINGTRCMMNVIDIFA